MPIITIPEKHCLLLFLVFFYLVLRCLFSTIVYFVINVIVHNNSKVVKEKALLYAKTVFFCGDLNEKQSVKITKLGKIKNTTPIQYTWYTIY